jgi:hypothetical protein
MSDPVSLVPPTQPPTLSELERLGNIFVAPSTTFSDIARGRRSWWLPFVVMCLFSYLLFGAITAKIGWQQVAENTLRANPKAMERFEQAPPGTFAQTAKQTAMGIEISFAATPVLMAISYLLIAAVLMGTVNFIFGGKASFADSLAVTVFGYLPSIVKVALGAAVAFFVAPESFNLQNFAPTSVGAFLSPTETSPWLYRLATALDATTIWCMVVLAIGFAVIAKVKRSSCYIAVFGWWAFITVIGVAWAAAMG